MLLNDLNKILKDTITLNLLIELNDEIKLNKPTIVTDDLLICYQWDNAKQSIEDWPDNFFTYQVVRIEKSNIDEITVIIRRSKFIVDFTMHSLRDAVEFFDKKRGLKESLDFYKN